MSLRYRYNHQSPKHRKRTVVIIGIVMLIMSAGGGLIFWDLGRSTSKTVSSDSREVQQVLSEAGQQFTVDEPEFIFELPGDWKETGRKNLPNEHSISWQSTKKNEDNRSLKLYIDTIPTTKAVNRLVPIMAQGNSLTVGDISENCTTFTGGGTLNAQEAQKLKPAPAKWQGVDFICNLPAVIENEVGTGSAEGINTFSVNGPAKGTHKYFFLYTDHNIQPNYTIIIDALRSFKAK